MTSYKQHVENKIARIYRTHYETYGPVWRKGNEGPELKALWDAWETHEYTEEASNG